MPQEVSRDLFIEDLIIASLNSIELLPLAYYKPGGLALTLYIHSEDEYCYSCPWREYYGSKRSFNLVNLSLPKLIKRYNELRPDLLFFSGGNYLEKSSSAPVLKSLRDQGIPVGAKHNIDKPIPGGDILKLLDALLLEVRVFTDLKKLSDFLDHANKNAYYTEILVDEIPEETSKRILFTAWVRNLCRVIKRNVIAFYMADKPDDFIENYMSLLQRFCENRFYIIASHQKFLPDTINCLSCGLQIGVRIDGVVVKRSVDTYYCPRCGARVFYGEFPRRALKRAVFTKIFI